MYSHYTPKTSPRQHDPIRHKIDQQVKDFLKHGGKIVQLPSLSSTARPVASAWQLSNHLG